jgi:hypothetical protein
MISNQPAFYFYHTLGCHLCEDAEVLVLPVADYLQQSWLKVDIADDDKLIDLYGIRIPVLYHITTGKTLGWPFDAESVHEFMQQCQLS